MDILKNDAPRLGELDLYDSFRRYVLEDVLGYDRHSIHTTPSKIVQEEHVDFVIRDRLEPNVQKPLLFVEAKKPFVRLDGKQYRDNERHGTPVEQLWNYMSNANPPPPYGICTNYDDFWLLVFKAGRYATHKFSFSSIRRHPDNLLEFVWAFHDILVGRAAGSLHDKSVRYDLDITDKFYGLFRNTRDLLVHEFGDGDEQALAKSVTTAQTFLNRLVFVFFAEDLRLANRRLVRRIDVAKGSVCGTSSNVYDAILNLFDAYAKGEDGLPEFNGGLFEEPIDRNLRFLDRSEDGSINQIITNIQEMAQYNFETDLNVNILGHIFEQSITDLDELKGDLKRKAEGIFYTPDQVTEYICNHTIIPFLSESCMTSAEDLIDEYRDRLDVLEKKIRTVRVLDPACGSGAFLIKAAEIILDIHKRIWDVYRIRRGETIQQWVEKEKIREIILHNIYGVDKSAESVSIARLAMFLKTVSKGEKLPDLSDSIKVGNSLIRNPEASTDSFDWESEFGEVLNPSDPSDMGFDIIIGNPPYVRQEDLENKNDMQLPYPNNLGVQYSGVHKFMQY